MILKRIPDKLKTDIEQFRSAPSGNNVLFFSADSGMGKTYAALSYCAENKDSLYFSFRHISAELAPKTFSERYPDVFKDCATWAAFFDCLQIYGKEKRPTVFFDDVGARNDKTDFYTALKNFLGESPSCGVLVVLIGRPWEQVEIPCQTISISPYSTQKIAETPSVSDKESVDIFCLSAGITELLSLYDTGVSFEENVKALLHINSPFYRLMNDKMRECFRTPESYNTLLYAMANGYNRISELSAFSGYQDIVQDNITTSFIPYKNGVTDGDFLIEDYFSWDGTIKAIVEDVIPDRKHPIKMLPNLPEKIKKELEKRMNQFTEDEFNGFIPLLDKIVELTKEQTI